MTFGDFPKEMEKIMDDALETEPIYNIILNDVEHCLFNISKKQTQEVIKLAGSIERIFLADGDHRCSSFTSLIQKLKKDNI